MATLTFDSIAVPAYLCPLSETKIDAINNKATHEVYFDSKPTVIYKGNSPTPALGPIVVSSESPQFNVTLREVFPGTQVGKFDLQVSYDRQRDSTKVQEDLIKQTGIEFKPTVPDGDSMTLSCLVMAPPNSDGSKRSLPFVFKGNLTWTLSWIDQGKPKNFKITTNLELYVLPSWLPKMFDAGIPLGLLRYESLLPAWMQLFDATKPGYSNDWPGFVVRALFYDRKMWYDTFSGASTYCSYASYSYNAQGYTPSTSCWIDLWLSDMNGLKGSAGAAKLKNYPVNCYDTAGLVQTIASLALPAATTKLRMIFMNEYGFINKTFLIGRHQNAIPDTSPVTYADPQDKCNNPFYTDPTKMVVADNSAERRSFSCHYYLTLQSGPTQPSTVYDACCGPQQGSLTLLNYTQAAIDTSAVLYFPNTWVQGGKPVNRPVGPGLLSNVFDGPGVENLASASSFTRAVTSVSGSGSLFERMNTTFGVNLQTPFEGSPAGNSAIVAVWTLANTIASITTEAQISIWRHNSQDSAKSAYGRRRAALLPGYTETPFSSGVSQGSDLSFSDPSPGFYMFWISIIPPPTAPQQHFLVVVEGSILNATIQSLVVAKLKSSVLNTTLPDNTSIDKIDSPNDTQKVGNIFSIKVTPSTGTKSWWRGFKVDTETNNVLFKNSTVDATTEVVTLNFLARRIGSDNIYISLYGPNLDTAFRAVGVTVV